jgi:peptide/nickel transport system substrate-binding protein
MSLKVRALLLSVLLLVLVTAPLSAQDGPLTEVGTPRTQTLIVDSLDGRIDNPMQMNPYQTGTRFNQGLHQLVYSNMWDINTISGELFPGLAAEMPEPLNDDYTQFRITVREGLAWSDGEPITINDVAYTIDIVLETPEFPYSGFLSQVVDSYTIIDDYTMELTTKRPEPRLAQTLGVTVWGDAFRVIPKHIWEAQENPAAFSNFPPVGSGPYTVRDVDPQGNWFLYEKRADWQNTDVGQIVGEPGPQYILFRFYGPEERRIIAGVQHNLDIFTDITPESWDILRSQNEYARAWFPNFPYANLDDPCERGIAFVNANPPYDSANVRWALALATDIQNVSLATFAGMLRVSPLPVPPIGVLQETYHKPMREWLMNFTLEDGYQPFDPNFAVNMAETLRAQGIEGIPEDEAALVDLFGVGWWKYDVEKAAQLLEAEGFTRNDSGSWLLPDGTPWQITINAPANFEVQSGRLAFAVADTWRQFGIDASVQQLEAGSFWSDWANGTFSAGSYWPGCGVIPDVFDAMNGTWNSTFVVPVGEPAPGNNVRHTSETLTNFLNQIEPLTSEDPRTVELTTEFMKAWVAEMPWLPMFGTSKFVPVDTYYWDGLPTVENSYEGPWWWWSLFKYMTPNFQPSGRQ